MRARFLLVVTTVLAVVNAGLTEFAHPAPATASPKLMLAAAGQGIENSFIVVLKQGMASTSSTDSVAERLATREGGRVGHVYSHGLQGFEVSLDEAAARRLAADPAVAYVEQNTLMRPQDTQINPPSDLDRIDQLRYPGNHSYTYPTTASDVRVYVIDSGTQASHFDFEFRVTDGPSFGTTAPANTDCVGHGTHVAGIIGSATYGAAKGVTLTPVRVFDCADVTSSAYVLAGLNWVYANHRPGELAVLNMSISGPPDSFVEQYVNALMSHGVVVTAAAGNERVDACTVSPARVPGVITVGGLADNDEKDHFTNIGSCVDIYAPSTSVVSTWHTFDFATEIRSGTSMSAGFAAGVAAMLRSLHPSLSVAQIHDLVRQTAARDVGWFPNQPRFSALQIQKVVPAPPLPVIDGRTGQPFGHQLTAAGGAGPYRWLAFLLPSGVRIDPNTGYLSGTFWSAGTFTATVMVSDATGKSGTITETWRIR
jgi:subtilisin family serine protease